MSTTMEPIIREQLIDRRRKLEVAVMRTPDNSGLVQLLGEVDAAL